MVYSSNAFLNAKQQKVNAQYIMDYLLKAGWTPNAVAGVLGNIQTESTLNPGIWQNLRSNNLNGGYGLVQWTPATKYINWAKNKGLDYTKIDTNLERILYEVKKNIQWSNPKMTFKQFTQSKASPYDLGMLFLKHYERPKDMNQPVRGRQAEQWFKILNTSIPKPEPTPTPSPTPIPTPILLPDPVPEYTSGPAKPVNEAEMKLFSYEQNVLTINDEFRLFPHSCEEKEVLNAERTLELTAIENESNKSAFDALENEAKIQLGNEEYIIKEKKGYMIGKTPAKKVYALHVFFCDLVESREDDELSGSLALSDLLSYTFNDSGWEYKLFGENPKKRKEGFGNNSKLSLFNDILKDFDLEYQIDTRNRTILVYPRIGALIDHIFRYNRNIKTFSITEDTRDLKTAINGYGAGTLKMTYISPAAKIFGVRWQEPVRDERFTIQDNLLEEMKIRLVDEPVFSVETEVTQIDEEYRPSLGDSVLTVHEPLKVDIDTRITEITRFPFDKNKIEKVVLSNVIPSKIGNIYTELNLVKKTNADLLKQYKKVEEKVEENSKDLLLAKVNLENMNGILNVNLSDYGAHAKGDDDTKGFVKLEEKLTNRIIDLKGKTYNVSKPMTGNYYVNGSFAMKNAKGEEKIFPSPYTIPRQTDSNVYVGDTAGTATPMDQAMSDSRGGYANTAVGAQALINNRASRNSAFGYQALRLAKENGYNTAFGDCALEFTGGYLASYPLGDRPFGTPMTQEPKVLPPQPDPPKENAGTRNTAFGSYSLRHNENGVGNVAVGRNAAHSNIDGDYNTAVGTNALSGSWQTGIHEERHHGSFNVALGYRAAFYTNNDYNHALGDRALYFNDSGRFNVALGNSALMNTIHAGRNVGIGSSAARDMTDGNDNVAIGTEVMRWMQIGKSCTAIGDFALSYDTLGEPLLEAEHCVGLGKQTRVSGDRQLQLGTTDITSYAFGAVQNRSDQRDKADITDVSLGLDFIMKLRPVDYKWDYRDDYIEIIDTTDEEGLTQSEVIKLPKDGSKKRLRNHHGFIAQEVKQVIDETGKDFGGFQDHSINGGNDVLSIGYEEFIAPLTKAVQEIKKEKDQEISELKREIQELKDMVSALVNNQ